MSYFKDTVAYINGNKKLRLPQRDAYIAAIEYFSNEFNKEALLSASMPKVRYFVFTSPLLHLKS
jgi:hypothetical protein